MQLLFSLGLADGQLQLANATLQAEQVLLELGLLLLQDRNLVLQLAVLCLLHRQVLLQLALHSASLILQVFAHVLGLDR